jgi:hypothetical protein
VKLMWRLRFALLLAAGINSLSVGYCRSGIARETKVQSSLVGRCAEDEDVRLRFFYLDIPVTDSRTVGFPPSPLVIIPASSEDPGLNTRPAWILYVAFPQLRSVMRFLENPKFSWEESSAPRKLVVDPFDLPKTHFESMEVAVSCSHGSAITRVKSQDICPFLSDVSEVLNNKLARDNFAHFMVQYSCSPRIKE